MKDKTKERQGNKDLKIERRKKYYYYYYYCHHHYY